MPAEPTTSSPVKDAIDVQSGRFEFFKQSLTLAAAGLAGTAAIFTDADKIPTRSIPLIFVALSGILLLATIVYSLMGISTYANLLGAVAAESDGLNVPPDHNSKTMKRGMIRHAVWTILLLGLSALMLLFFAAAHVLWREKPKAEFKIPQELAQSIAQATNAAMTATAANQRTIATLDTDIQQRLVRIEELSKQLDEIGKRLEAKASPVPALSRPAWHLIQKALKSRGYYHGTIDGFPGPQTIGAISAYQASLPDHQAVTGTLSAQEAGELLGQQ